MYAQLKREEPLPKRIPEEALAAVEKAVQLRAGGASLGDAADVLEPRLPVRTLQYRLKYLVDAGRLLKEGDGRWAKYRLPPPQSARVVPAAEAEGEEAVPLSSQY
jgi:hypothetical protein